MVSFPHVERTPDGHRLVVDRVVAADADTVWDILTDTDRWPEWGPSVTAVRSPDRYIEAGSTGELQVAGGPWVSFEVTACTGLRWTWRVARVPATGHAVTPLGAGRCRVAFEVPLLVGGYTPVCERALGRVESAVTQESEESNR